MAVGVGMRVEVGVGLAVGEVVGVGVEGGLAMTDEYHHGGCRGALAGFRRRW